MMNEFKKAFGSVLGLGAGMFTLTVGAIVLNDVLDKYKDKKEENKFN